jgi:hypothetical protein
MFSVTIAILATAVFLFVCLQSDFLIRVSLKQCGSALALLLLSVCLVACGGGSGGPAATKAVQPVQPPIVVAVSPSSCAIDGGMSQQFQAQVSNAANGAVTWSLQEGTAGGLITPAGFYTPPTASGTYHVVATSVADATKSAIATITILPRLSVSPANAVIDAGQTLQLTAMIDGKATAVTWSVQEGTAGGLITPAGFYTPPTASGTYHAIATSVADVTKSAIATITVLPSLSVSPANSFIDAGQTLQLTAMIDGSATAVKWSVQEGTAGGSITSAGLYTSPKASGTYHAIATSLADATKSAIATITVLPLLSVSPANTVINAGQSVQLTAALDGTPTSALTWSVQEGTDAGSITADGMYSAPSTAGTYHVLAASPLDARVSASMAVTVVVPSQPQLFMSKASLNQSDLFLTFISDSTCYSYGYLGFPNVATERWCLVFAESLAQKLPAYTVKFRQWQYDSSAGPGASYDPWITLQGGPGANTLWISNASFPGATSYDFLGARFQTAVVDTTPDLLVVSMGHNYPVTCPTCWPNYTLDLTESTTKALPNAGVLLMSQNPTIAPYAYAGTTADKTKTMAHVAQLQGYGYVNVYQAFLSSGYPLADLLGPDGLHPTSPDSQVGPENGSHLWATEVVKYFVPAPNGLASPQQPSSLTTSVTEHVNNGTFRDYADTSATPASWNTGGAAVTTTDVVNFESPNGYSVKVSAAVGKPGYIQQDLSVSDVAGRCMTLTAHVWIDLAQPDTAGKIAMGDDQNMAINFGSGSILLGAWRWVSVTRCFDPGISRAFIRLYGDSASTGGFASFGQVSLAEGELPSANFAF